jgi:hypothetical protein
MRYPIIVLHDERFLTLDVPDAEVEQRSSTFVLSDPDDPIVPELQNDTASFDDRSANDEHGLVASPLDLVSDLHRLCPPLLPFPQVAGGPCIRARVMQRTQCDQPLGPMMVLNVPRRVEVVIFQIWLDAIWMGANEPGFPT